MSSTASRGAVIAYNGYDSGLGNRVRVVLGAQSLAELEGRSFAYVWPTGKLFGPRFSDLWDFPGRTVPRAVSRLLAHRYPYVDASLDWLDDGKRRERLWQIRTGSEIQLPPQARPWAEAYRDLVPVDAIAEAVTRFSADELGGEPYVGVMIRAHAVSHAATRATSPVEWFEGRMRRMVEQRPGTRFFVSCDVPEVQERICRTIPGCTGQLDKGAYNSVEGVRSAVADVYLLAGAGYLLGPHFSSFLHLAQHLADDRIPVETAVKDEPPVVDPAALGVVEDPLRPSVRRAVPIP
ncbi:hypothetical protein QOZ88_17250 [Blastococcus sp. BMG 814]|uniref:Uncharacterized protein n=1 Tax=Blastococcus carthaginiensis TaxID=3050034 RepID=A0ABT9IFM8_9ACTN|nr:hypothetical protein [Blastococcus carthaginiensis]MDP5184384.1 hypothetical protein [Blastococcus carthaginiensis]